MLFVFTHVEKCHGDEKRLVNVLRAEENRIHCKDGGAILGLE